MSAFATNTQVSSAWLQSLTDFSVDPSKVGAALPSDVTIWADTGFWQVTTVGGGISDLGTKQPVTEISVWAAKPDSQQAPFNRAERLATQVLNAAYAARSQTLTINTTDGAQATSTDVFLLGVNPVSLPLRVPDPRTGFARVMFQVQLWWDEQVTHA